MCGISGLVGFENSRAIIRLMNDSLKHRGPDAEGEWFGGTVALGHRRLSIIDLSVEANQPFIKDGLVIVYNGEVYNFPELRDELKRKGISFRTRSDTEVVLELFRAYKEESFSKLLGMFSFCIYDIATRELFLARDYFGIKPLYYTALDDNKFAFSSELKALIKLPGINKNLNPQALASCVNYLWIPGNESMFLDIKKVPPAHFLYLRTDRQGIAPEIKRYWELNIKGEYLDLSEEGLKQKLRQLLEDSVSRHLIADVPVGGFLSGGIDSSLVSVIAKRFNPDLSTYTISIAKRDQRVEGMPDDNRYAKSIARLFDINHTDIAVYAEAIGNLREMVYILDEPIADPAAINTYLISRLARDRGIKVLLSGMGADEIFAGYRRQSAVLLADRLSSWPHFLKNGAGKLLEPLPVRLGRRGIKFLRWGKRFFSLL